MPDHSHARLKLTHLYRGVAFFALLGAFFRSEFAGPLREASPTGDSEARAPASISPASGNVIFVTLDGVRYREVFWGVDPGLSKNRPAGEPVLMRLKQWVSHSGGLWFGDPAVREMVISNPVAKSLPGYRALLTGEHEEDCDDNYDCENIDRETLFDYLHALGVAGNDLAAFASWSQIGLALEKHPGHMVRSVAFDPIRGGTLTPRQAASFANWERLARSNRPKKWVNSRSDYITWNMALSYLKKFRPRLLYVSTVETDEYGHLDRYEDHLQSLDLNDAWFENLRRALAELGDYGDNTSIVVTTDHGRGGKYFSKHGTWFSGSFRVWAAVIPSPALQRRSNLARGKSVQETYWPHPRVPPRKLDRYLQTQIRPTIEQLLGVPARRDGKAQNPLVEIVPKH